MTRKHVYFHSSNLDYIKDIRDEDIFEPVYLYPKNELRKCHPNEFGRIKTDSLYIHLIMGSIRQDDCPWCGCNDLTVRIIEDKSYDTMNPFAKDLYFIECTHCRSTGPRYYMDPMVSLNTKHKEELIQLIKMRYSNRCPWEQNIEITKAINADGLNS